jgi:rhamnose utilization protein RhaD (predicted bifunctional aldolase and dehydrogenase)
VTRGHHDNSEFRALLSLSARLGRDPLKTQAAGGNTSLKRGGIMWIKASGTWLADAETRDIMVPVELRPLLDALEAEDSRVETAAAFVQAGHNPSGLRPSVETAVHAVIPFPVVVHIHCVNTIALAVREDAEALIAERLKAVPDVAPLFIPYIRPGVPLARTIAARLSPETNVIILGNHGLVVAAETVADAETLLERVAAAFAALRREAPAPGLTWLREAAASTPYRLPADLAAHDVATNLENLDIARQGTFYPDHVVFLGPGVVILEEGTVAGFARRFDAAGITPPLMIAVPGKGVLLHESVLRGADELARGLAEVTARISRDARLNTLSAAEEDVLFNWDAEIYRRALAASRAAG